MTNGEVQQPVPPETPPPSQPQKDNTVMLVLSYLWLLALIPLLTEKEDKEVQWHAKHGLVLLVAEVVLQIVFGITTRIIDHIVPGVGCLVGCFGPGIVGLGFLAIRIMCIVKATKHEKFTIPYISEYADRM